MNRAIRVLLVDEHEVARQGLRRMLEAEKDVEVVGDYHSADEALTQIDSLAPDVVLMEPLMPGSGGIEAIRRFKNGRHSSTPGVVVISNCADALPQAMGAGAAGFVLNDISQAELAQVIREVYKSDHVPERDGVSEDCYDLVIPPPARAAQVMQFISLLERSLQAGIMRTVGSWERGTTVTISLKPTPVSGLMAKLRAMAPVEGVAEEVQEAESLPGLLRGLRLSRPKVNRRRKVIVALRACEGPRAPVPLARTSQDTSRATPGSFIGISLAPR